MKSTFSILALATSAAATGFLDANSFNCPGNSDNHCQPELSSGFDFSDLGLGSFSSYKGFQWSGFSCGSMSQKRSRVDRRTSGKAIGGVCSSDKSKSPSFGYQGGSGDGFSLGSIELHPEFDCDLELHYGMGDGSVCKQRSSCSKSGTTVHNTQCAGAKNVTIVYPSQPSKPKPSCTVSVPTISFSCGSSSTSKAHTTSSKPYVATTTSEVKTTKTTSEVKSTTTVVKSTTTTEVKSTTVIKTTAKTTTSPSAVETTSTTYKGFQNSTFSTLESSTSAVQSTSSVSTTAYTTSTVTSTTTKTITSCAETVTNCPAHSTITTVETTVYTTVCPVTESSPATTASSASSVNVVSTTTVSASYPSQTLPCPTVVPQCLNTFLFALTCSDNTDSACYCPDEIFIKNVFDCVYAHGETDEVISEAIIFVQGLCAPYVPGNPAIITPTVTSYITATPTSQSAVYTTITATITQVVPCTDTSGSPIPSSSSTVTVTQTATVPQVGFTTGSSGVGVIPVTTQPYIAPSTVATATSTSFGAPKSNNTVPTAKPSASQVTVSGAGRTIGASFGLGLALAALAAAL